MCFESGVLVSFHDLDAQSYRHLTFLLESWRTIARHVARVRRREGRHPSFQVAKITIIVLIDVNTSTSQRQSFPLTSYTNRQPSLT